jgi:hypothetical protein
VAVDVEGEPAYARAADVDDLATAEPFDEVRLLPAFDQFVLGPGTGDVRVIDAHRRAAISKAAGWISPVVVCRGRVAGTWSLADGALDVTLFAEAGSVPAAEIAAEARRIGPDATLTVNSG